MSAVDDQHSRLRFIEYGSVLYIKPMTSTEDGAVVDFIIDELRFPYSRFLRHAERSNLAILVI